MDEHASWYDEADRREDESRVQRMSLLQMRIIVLLDRDPELSPEEPEDLSSFASPLESSVDAAAEWAIDARMAQAETPILEDVEVLPDP